MNKCEVIKTDEKEIVALINKHYPQIDYVSVVGAEELGNQWWFVKNVGSTYKGYDPLKEVKSMIEQGKTTFVTRTLLDALSLKGVIPYGDYLINCTW